MDELQAVYTDKGLFMWGISSNINEVFTPKERIVKICKDYFGNQKLEVESIMMELPCQDNIPIMPESMKLFYTQFDVNNKSFKQFSIFAVKIDNLLIAIMDDKIQGVLLGDSYKFFRLCLLFSFDIVSRQRFIPAYKNNFSYYYINLDSIDDYDKFLKLISKAPDSIKINVKTQTKKIVKLFIEETANEIISMSLQKDIKYSDETETDKWIAGLLGKKLKLHKNIKEDIDDWLITRKVNNEIDYNMLFKLEEPVEENEEWCLSYNMQSKNDPSYIICLSEIWNNSSNISIKNVKMHLLSELGSAAKVSDTIEKSLYKPSPSKIKLNTEEAMKFIKNDSFFLKDLGYVVHIPNIIFTKVNRFKISVKLKNTDKFKIKGTGMLGNALFDFDYSVAIGDLELTYEEFVALSKSKEKLVNIKGKWVELNTGDVSKVIDFFKNKEKLSLKDMMFINSSDHEFEIDDIIAPQEFKKQIDGLFDFKKIDQIEVPGNLNANLRPYQKIGFSWMSYLSMIGFGGILADDMGLGKTIQTIAYILHNSKQCSLIVCPTSTLGNWSREIKKFSPNIKSYIHHGTYRNKKDIQKIIQENDVVLTSYALARLDEELFREIKWDNVILDEAQNIKNPLTKQSIAINNLQSNNRFCLTGTPIENRLSELWSIMNFVNPGFLSSWKVFKKNFAEPIELFNDKEAYEKLNRILSVFIMRRLKTDKTIIQDLPKKTEIKEYCSLTKEQVSLYQAVVEDSLKKIEESDSRQAQIMATLIKLKQICNHPSNFLKDRKDNLADRSGKVERLREIVDVILKNDEKCLIFSQYKEMGRLLKADIEERFGVPVCFLHGALNRKTRDNLISVFQSDDPHSPKIFILSLKAGGVGINLTKANHVIHFDRWWNPAVENQATDRAFRIGQKKDVFVYKFITTGTIEERIDEMIERKLSLLNSVLAKRERPITDLNNKELKELFALRKECMGE